MIRTDTNSVTAQDDVAILARVLGNEEGSLSMAMAKHILGCGFTETDKSRMHNLAERNQNDELSEVEKRELLAYGKAGTLLSILKSRARQIIRRRAATRSPR